MTVIAFHELGASKIRIRGDALTPVNLVEVQASVLVTGNNEADGHLHEGSKGHRTKWRPSAVTPLLSNSDLAGILEVTAECVDGIAPGDFSFGMIRVKWFTLASRRLGQPSTAAERRYVVRAHRGKTISATTPTHGRLIW